MSDLKALRLAALELAEYQRTLREAMHSKYRVLGLKNYSSLARVINPKMANANLIRFMDGDSALIGGRLLKDLTSFVNKPELGQKIETCGALLTDRRAGISLYSSEVIDLAYALEELWEKYSGLTMETFSSAFGPHQETVFNVLRQSKDGYQKLSDPQVNHAIMQLVLDDNISAIVESVMIAERELVDGKVNRLRELKDLLKIPTMREFAQQVGAGTTMISDLFGGKAYVHAKQTMDELITKAEKLLMEKGTDAHEESDVEVDLAGEVEVDLPSGDDVKAETVSPADKDLIEAWRAAYRRDPRRYTYGPIASALKIHETSIGRYIRSKSEPADAVGLAQAIRKLYPELVATKKSDRPKGRALTDEELIKVWRQACKDNLARHPYLAIAVHLGCQSHAVSRWVSGARKPSEPAKLAQAIRKAFPHLDNSATVTKEGRPPVVSQPDTPPVKWPIPPVANLVETASAHPVTSLQIHNVVNCMLDALNDCVKTFGYLMANGGTVSPKQQRALARLCSEIFTFGGIDETVLHETFSIEPIDPKDPLMKTLLGSLAIINRQ